MDRFSLEKKEEEEESVSNWLLFVCSVGYHDAKGFIRSNRQSTFIINVFASKQQSEI